MRTHKKINQVLASLDKKNQTENIFLNVILNEFVTFTNKITIPQIPVKELNYTLAPSIISSIVEHVPEFLQNHALLKEKKPANEQHWLHFMQRIEGKLINFVHLFKIDLKFGGDSSNIIEKGNTDFYPSFNSDRIYYKSRLIPELKKFSRLSYDFQALRLKDINLVESDNQLFTSSIFDEIDTKKISIELCSHVPSEVFCISPNIYPFISYDYFTACLNVLNPTASEINTAASLFEPLFMFLYSIYQKIETVASIDKILDAYQKEISLENGHIILTPQFQEDLKKYFQRFNLFTDENLALFGRKRVDIDR